MTGPKPDPRIRTRKTGYTVIPNGLLQPGQISARAWGIYCYLRSRPEGWDTRLSDLRRWFKEGRDAIYSALRELVEAGLMEKEEYLNEDNLKRSGFALVYELPAERQTQGRKSGSRRSAPDPDFQDPGNEAPQDDHAGNVPDPDSQDPGSQDPGSPDPEKADPFKEEPLLSGTTTEEVSTEETKTPPVAAVGSPTVRTARGAAAPAAQPRNLTSGRLTISRIGRYRDAEGWVKARHLAPMAGAALEHFGQGAILRYAAMVAAEGRFAEQQHIPEFREVLRRLGRDVASWDACRECGQPPADCPCRTAEEPLPQIDEPWTAEDDATFERVLDRFGVTAGDLGDVAQGA